MIDLFLPIFAPVLDPALAKSNGPFRLRVQQRSVLNGCLGGILSGTMPNGCSVRNFLEIRLADSTSDGLIHLQTTILKLIGQRVETSVLLDHLCELVQQQLEHSVCSVMRLDRATGWLYIGSAPCIPDEIKKRFDGLVPAELAGACGTAVYTRERVLIEDAQTDPRFASLRELAIDVNLRSCWSVPLFSSDGESIFGTFAISRTVPGLPTAEHERLLEAASDVARIALEMEDSAQALDASHKLETLGVFAGGMAHDFNNLLTVILGSAELARDSAGEEADPLLRSICDAAQRASELTRQVLTYAGRLRTTFHPTTDLAATVEEARQLCQTKLGQPIDCRVEIAGVLPSLRIDPRQLKQLIMDLVINASESMDGKGTVCMTFHFAEPDGAVAIRVSDTGCGMNAETQRRMFDPFFSTKSGQRGLGLSTVQGVVRAHGGKLEVHSSEGSGTVVTVSLPIDQTEPSVAIDAEFASLDGSTILVVDDEPMVRTTVRGIIERQGGQVIEASGGGEALDIIDEQRSEIDAVLVDLQMPEVDGIAVVEQGSSMIPNTSFVLMSGRLTERGSKLVQQSPGVSFLQKPFLAGVLGVTLGKALHLARSRD